MFLDSIKEINRLRKEINKLLSKWTSNIYLKVTTETFSKLRFSGFKKFVNRSVFGELQLTKMSLNIKTSNWNVQIRDLRAKLCVVFLLFYGTSSKMENPTHSFRETNLASCFRTLIAKTQTVMRVFFVSLI